MLSGIGAASASASAASPLFVCAFIYEEERGEERTEEDARERERERERGGKTKPASSESAREGVN